MNCNDFELNVPGLARCELSNAVSRELGLDHAATCTRCANRLAAERALLAGIRSVVADLAGQKAPFCIEEALVAAFRDQVRPPVNVSPIPVTNRPGRHWQLAAAAAIILVLIAAAAFRQHSSAAVQEREAKVITPGPVSIPTSIDNEGAPGRKTAPQPAGPLVQARARMRRRGPRPEAGPSEQVTEFFPLMEGVDLDSLEAVQVVRIELPASALGNFGLPIPAEMASVPVKADVVLGYDGQARAIRFVQ